MKGLCHPLEDTELPRGYPYRCWGSIDKLRGGFTVCRAEASRRQSPFHGKLPKDIWYGTITRPLR